MSESRLQPGRLVAEEGQRGAQPSADVVSAHYRLVAADLPSGSIVTTVRAVTLQGLDTPKLVLHGERLLHPLLLDPEHIQALTRLTGSPLFADWVGCAVALHVVGSGDAQHIVLTAPGRLPRTALAAKSRGWQPQRKKEILLTLFVCTFLLLAAFIVVQWPSFSIILPR